MQTDYSQENVRIVTINFSFENGELIEMLKERGEALRECKWEEVKKIEKEVEHLKNHNFEKLTRPISAFITFETE